MNQEDIDQVTKDFHRFSKLHSWYKHLPINGEIFVFYKNKGQQVRYNFDKCLTEANQDKEYWYFLRLEMNKEYVKKLIKSGKDLYWSKLGSFLRGIEEEGTKYEHFMGFHLIERNNQEKKINYLKNKYPSFIDNLNEYDDQYESQVMNIAKNEHQEYLNHILEFKKITLDML
jgi:hypothetical protein